MLDRIYKFTRIMLWILLGVNLMAFLAFTGIQQDKLLYKSVSVQIDHDTGTLSFIDRFAVISQIQDSLGLIEITGVRVSDALPVKIEEILLQNLYIKSAAAWTDIPGNLYIKVKQHRPIGRVMNGDVDYYISEEGTKLPWSRDYTPDVPIVCGGFTEDFQCADSMITEKGKEVYCFLKAIDTSEYHKSLCDQLYYLPGDRDLRMIPVIGDVEIIFGDVTELSDKLNKLKAFYSKVLNTGKIYKYKTINLKYKNQVVCTFAETWEKSDTSNYYER